MAEPKQLGAVPVGASEVEFRVWAPHARSVAVRLETGDLRPIEDWGHDAQRADLAGGGSGEHHAT